MHYLLCHHRDSQEKEVSPGCCYVVCNVLKVSLMAIQKDTIQSFACFLQEALYLCFAKSNKVKEIESEITHSFGEGKTNCTCTTGKLVLA